MLLINEKIYIPYLNILFTKYIHNYTNKINKNKIFNILLHVYIYKKIKSKYCTLILHMLILHIFNLI